ncbi:MAG: Gfo/Idh/MocA family oxidoreductase [Bacteroidales bacterium]|nr:Gfo/Idh/MocA family oxidoreductase [Bacteroidales bacterium]
MTNGIVNIGIIGAGMVAEEHITSGISMLDNARVTWVADINDKQLAKFKNGFNIPNATTNYREMLADKALDAVIICTPPRLHKQMYLDCLCAKKHTLVEKPFACTLADAEYLIQLARERNLLC